MGGDPVRMDGATLTPEALHAVAMGAPAALDVSAWARMSSSAERLAEQGDVDPLCSKWAWLVGGEVPSTTAAAVRAFIVSHCAGVGEPLPRAAVRASMAARVNVLATGMTGCRPAVAELYLAMLEADVVPVVPRQGSVGAAGDLAPLAHIARVALRFGGQAWRGEVLLPAAEAMAGLPEIELTGKEALSLINGATVSAALAGLAVARARRLMDTAVMAAALSFEVVRADLGCLSREALAARRHGGAVTVAERVAALIEGSELCGRGRKADPFSIRCTPAVLGSALDALDYVAKTVTDELNGACDNPLLCGDELIEAGNFHGAPIGLAMDHLKVALTQVASISERRTFRLTYGQLSGLPSFLVAGTGLNSGLMLAQYTAASLVSECKGLAHPASVDSVPTAQHHEDHVSMAPIAARGALAICEALADVLAIELLCGAQGLDFHLRGEHVRDDGELQRVDPLAPGAKTRRVYDVVRAHIARWADDQVLHPDLERAGRAVRLGAFTDRPGAW